MITFRELYERYATDVYRFAYWLTGNGADAEDITSETMIRAWVGANQNTQTETVKAYLFTIARNLHLKQCREAKKHVELDRFHPDSSPNPEQITASRQELQQALFIIQQLPETDRAALLLRVQHNLPYAEIARILAISPAAAKVKVHRARLKLAIAKTGTEVT